MKKTLLLFIGALFVFTSFSQTTFIKEYFSNDFIALNTGSSSSGTNDKGEVIHSYANGDFLIGYSVMKNNGSGVYGMVFARVTSDGNILWQKEHFNSSLDGYFYNLTAAIELNGDSYITGFSGIPSGTTYPFIIRLDGGNGHEVWSHLYEDGGARMPRDIITTSDNSILVVGNETSFGTGAGAPFVLKVASDGTFGYLSTYYVPSQSFSYSNAICENNNGEYVVFFITASQDLGFYKINALNGEIIPGSAKELDIPGASSNSLLLPSDVYYNSTNDNYTLLIQDGNSLPCLIRLNGALDPQWAKISSISYPGFSISYFRGCDLKAVSNGYIISGIGDFGSTITYEEGRYVMKTDLAGNFIWCKKITNVNSPSYSDKCNFEVTQDGMYFPNVYQGLRLIKTDFSGNLLAPTCETESIPVTTDTYTDFTILSLNPIEVSNPITEQPAFTFFNSTLDTVTICFSECTDPFTAQIDAGGPTAICYNAFPVTLDGSIIGTNPGPFTYEWSDGSTASSLVASTASSLVANGPGTYSVSITSTNGCEATGNITLTQIYPLNMNPITTMGTNCGSAFLMSDPNSGFNNHCWYEQSNPLDCIGTGVNFYASAPGTYCVIADQTNGCGTATRCFTVNPSPEITFPELGPYCENDNTDYLLGYNNSAFNTGVATPYGGVYSSSNPGVFAQQIIPGLYVYYFNPSLAGPGVHQVEYSYTSQGCTSTASVDVEVTSFWNQTTIDTYLKDKGNDIVVDNQGNLYVTGVFFSATKFLDQGTQGNIPISNVSTKISAYVASYNSCGELLWVNYDINGNNSAGKGIALDEERGLIFITGRCDPRGITKFLSESATLSNASPVNSNVGFSGASYHVSSFQMSDGAYNNSYSPVNNNWNKITKAIDVVNVNATTSHIAICGYLERFENDRQEVFVQKLKEVNGSYQNNWVRFSVDSDFNNDNKANDVVIDNINNRVHVIGNYNRMLKLRNGQNLLSSTQLNTGPIIDVFTASYSLNNGVAQTGDIKNSGIGNNVELSGNGIDVDVNGLILYTGSLKSNLSTNTVSTNFLQNGNSINLLANSTVGFVSSSTGLNTEVDAGLLNHVSLTGITSNAQGTYVVGYFDGGTLNVTPFLSGSGNGNEIVVIALDNQLSPIWSNVTQAPNSSGDQHLSTRIAANEFYTYSTGAYRGELGYDNIAPIPPYSGNLISTTNNTNTFIIRNDLTSGQFTSTETAEAEMMTEDLMVYPNPSYDGNFTLNVPNEEFKLSVYSGSGELIYSEIGLGTGTVNIDLTKQAKGMYILSFTSNSNQQTIKLIKQ